jgi:hypothetical protein
LSAEQVKQATSLELLPPLEKELEVGEEVTWGIGNYAHKVLGIELPTVFVSSVGRSLKGVSGCNKTNDVLHDVSELRRPDGRPIKVG